MTVAGNLGQAIPLQQRMQFRGRWQQHPKFGLQLACQESQLLEDDPARRALSEVTSQVAGLGPKTAEALGKAFGEKIVQVGIARQSGFRCQD